MADKKMNQFPTASDVGYIYAETTSGEQVRISKADLAAVVAELIGVQINTLAFTIGARSNREINLDKFASSSYAEGFKHGIVVINAPSWGTSGVLHITSDNLYILGYKHAAFIDWMNITKQGNILIIENIGSSYSNFQISIISL